MSKENTSHKNIFSYQGPINIDLISFLSNYMKQHILTEALTMNKIYKVFIELTQNVSYYSAIQHNNSRSFGSGVGWFRIDENKNHFIISTGNYILKVHGPILETNRNEINSLSEEDLRDLKRKTRSMADLKDIGAHIGLIQTGLLTGNTLEMDVKPMDDKYSFLTITAKVNKRKINKI